MLTLWKRGSSRCELALRDQPNDFASSSDEGRNLADLTTTAKLGQCDAFLSHSWHCDSYLDKWNALTRWADEFCSDHEGR